MTEPSNPTRFQAAAVQRNRDPILSVLKRVLPDTGVVLEIASGTGEHAAYFAARLPGLTWRPSDADSAMLQSIAAWAEDAAPSPAAPVALNVRDAVWPVEAADAIVCINMIHIAPWESCLGLMAGAGRILKARGVLYLYGPYKIGGRHTAASNAAFDESLRRRDPAWGVRDLDDVRKAAAEQGLMFRERVAMPADNLSVVFEKIGTP
jgi:SAM-dependent methyltransferase